MFVGWFGGWLVMGAASRFWLMGLVRARFQIYGHNGRFRPKFKSRIHEFARFVLQEGGHQKIMFFLLLVLCIEDTVQRIY